MIPAGDFSITVGAGAPTIQPGQIHPVQVTFAPGTLGAHTATLRVLSDDADEPTTDVGLTGNGVATPVPDIAVTPIAHDFGNVFEGLVRITQSGDVAHS